MSRTYRTINRLFQILEHVGTSRQGCSVRDVHQALKEQHPADERTYRRDLENLEYLGFLNVETVKDGATSMARYKARRAVQAGRAIQIDLRELLALYVAKNCLEPLRETPLYPDLKRVFARMESALGPKSAEYLNELTQELRVDAGPLWGLGIEAPLFDTLERACAEGHVVQADYDSASSGKKHARRLGPHFLYLSKGSIYLVAEDIEVGQVKTFALPRMANAVMTEEAYTGAKVDPETHFSGSMGVFQGKPERVELLFHGPLAAFVQERRWHASQKVNKRADGKVLVTFDVAVTPELVGWILGFGDGVRVISPKALVDQVVEASESLLAQYVKPSKTA